MLCFIPVMLFIHVDCLGVSWFALYRCLPSLFHLNNTAPKETFIHTWTRCLWQDRTETFYWCLLSWSVRLVLHKKKIAEIILLNTRSDFWKETVWAPQHIVHYIGEMADISTADVSKTEQLKMIYMDKYSIERKYAFFFYGYTATLTLKS